MLRPDVAEGDDAVLDFIGFEEDADNYLHIPAYALAPAATGCYIKKEYLPKEVWIRMNMPYIYQLPITPLFGN